MGANKSYYSKPENIKEHKQYNKEYYSKPENIEKRKIFNSKPEVMEKNRISSRDYYYNNKDKRKIYNSKPEVIEKRKAYRKNKRKTDPIFNMKDKLRCRVYQALRSQSVIKNNKTIDLLGCTFEFYRNYLSSLFTEGMSWDKLMSAEIEIDHIKPLKEFDLTKESEQFKAFHYTNTQPLWLHDNRIKSDKY